MNPGKRSVSALLAVMMTATAVAEIKWLEKTYNYGVIKEADGPATGSVRFVNNGPDATYISRVRPSCGCTGASYTQDMLQPGDTATITFTYNPAGRPGKFDKTVKVYVGKDSSLTSVRITGTVIGDDSTLESHFPIETGDLRTESVSFPVGEIKRGAHRHT
ncbi:MAG: DUF1573 domain-containing protein, partial [Muribaculaceae bacterium]|nr:DUF1573 domain-containing protein [Muribaculaceae bacterium]